jgi:methylamine---glutamate N-methyltransferase subunit B
MESVTERGMGYGLKAAGQNTGPIQFDLATTSVRELNRYLHRELTTNAAQVVVNNPDGAHSIAAGLNTDVDVQINGHVGYYVAGMNKHAHVTVNGNAGPGAAENMMSGLVRIKGFASTSAGASARGGVLVVEGDASLRCGISLKGADIVVGGSVGSFSAFMAQAGRMVICGDAGDALGDSLYEAVIYVRGEVKSLGADARYEAMSDSDRAAVAELLSVAGLKHDPTEFRRIASARSLYHWNADANQEY